LMWDAFIRWYASHAGDGEEHLVDEDAVISRRMQTRNNNEELQSYRATIAFSRFYSPVQN